MANPKYYFYDMQTNPAVGTHFSPAAITSVEQGLYRGSVISARIVRELVKSGDFSHISWVEVDDNPFPKREPPIRPLTTDLSDWIRTASLNPFRYVTLSTPSGQSIQIGFDAAPTPERTIDAYVSVRVNEEEINLANYRFFRENSPDRFDHKPD